MKDAVVVRWRPALVACAVGGVVLTCKLFSAPHLGETGRFPPDDVFTQLVYVRHFLSTGRFFWNEGDGAVDGFTSLLDTLVKSGAAWVTGSRDLLGVAFASTISFSWAAILVAARLAQPGDRRGLAAGWLFPVVAGLAVALQEGYVETASFMLETSLFAFLLLAVMAAAPPWHTQERSLARRAGPVLFGMASVLLALTRPEGVLASAIVLGATWLLFRKSDDARPLRAIAVFWAVALFSYVLWHRLTFGAFATNTYYAKTSASRWLEIKDGLGYVRRSLGNPGQWPLWGWLALMPWVYARGRWTEPAARRRFLLAGVLAATLIACMVCSGGDPNRGVRFFVPPFTAVTASMIIATAALLGRPKRLATAFLVATFTAELLGRIPRRHVLAGLIDNLGDLGRGARYLASERSLSWQAFFGRPGREDLRGARRNVEHARHCFESASLALEALAAGGRVAQHSTQLLKYFADDLRVLDLSGLNDRAIAHQTLNGAIDWGKLDLTNVLDQRPELWLLDLSWDAPLTVRELASQLAQIGSPMAARLPLAQMEQVEARYASSSLEVEGCGRFFFYRRRDLLTAPAPPETTAARSSVGKDRPR